MVVEGGGAVGVAAMLGGKIRLGPADVTVCVLSGGNIEPVLLQEILTG